jgi:hypothetical protein
MSDTPFWLELIQAGSYGAGAAAAVVAVFKYSLDRKTMQRTEADAAARKQAETETRREANAVAARDLEWRRAESGQKLMEAMVSDPLAWNALVMLDWTWRDYPVENPKWTITRDEVLRALRTDSADFTDKEVFIRDAFDTVYYHFERIQHLIGIALVSHDHARFPIAYYTARIREDWAVHENYLRSYEFRGALELIETMATNSPLHPKPLRRAGGSGGEDLRSPV